MAYVASQPPMAVTSGFTQDAPFQPLSDCGVPNPFFYHQFADDFDSSVLVAGTSTIYTLTKSGTGAAIVGQAGLGGQALFTAGTTAGNASAQLPVAGFTVNNAPKKTFYVCRMQLATAVLTDSGISIIAGLIQTTTTPGTVTDGVFFKYTNGVLTFNSNVGSVNTAVTIPTAAYSTAIVGNTFFDLAFFSDRNGNLLAYVDTQLVGFVPQSNIGTTGNPQNAGAVARLTPTSLTAVNLTPMLATVQLGTTNMTMAADFHGVFQER